MSEIEVNNMKTYHASQKRAILNWQKKNKEKINEYNRQRHKLKMENDSEYKQKHKERTHQYYLRKKSLQIPQNNEEKIIK